MAKPSQKHSKNIALHGKNIALENITKQSCFRALPRLFYFAAACQFLLLPPVFVSVSAACFCCCRLFFGVPCLLLLLLPVRCLSTAAAACPLSVCYCCVSAAACLFLLLHVCCCCCLSVCFWFCCCARSAPNCTNKIYEKCSFSPTRCVFVVGFSPKVQIFCDYWRFLALRGACISKNLARLRGTFCSAIPTRFCLLAAEATPDLLRLGGTVSVFCFCWREWCARFCLSCSNGAVLALPLLRLQQRCRSGKSDKFGTRNPPLPTGQLFPTLRDLARSPELVARGPPEILLVVVCAYHATKMCPCGL